MKKWTEVDGDVSYLMKYELKLPRQTDVLVYKLEERRSLGRNIASYIIPNDMRLYMRARVMVSIEVVWHLLEFRHVWMSSNVRPYTILLWNEWSVLILNEYFPGTWRDTALMRYFSRP